MYRLTLEQVEEIKPYLFGGLDPNFACDLKPGDIYYRRGELRVWSTGETCSDGIGSRGGKTVIVKSVNWDFYRMAINHGLRILVDWAVVDAYTSGEQLAIDDENHLLYLNKRAYKLPYVDAEFQEILEKGGLINTFS